jgi:hypothetical protein
MTHMTHRFGLAVAALALAAAACDPEIAPQFVLQGAGALDGLLFTDADRNGAFDPSAGDDPVPGVTLLVRERGTEQTFTGATVVTDAGGRFTVPELPLGTHDLFIDTTTVPSGVAFCQNPVQVTIARGQVRFAPVGGRFGCIIDIADAEAQPQGTFVTVRGLVTAAPGQIRSEASYIEDETGAVQLFDGDLRTLGIEVGDRIEVSGTLGSFGQELEILDNVTLNAIDKAFAVPVPDTLTSAEVAAAGAPPTNPVQGTFVIVRRAQQMSAFTLGGGRNAQFNDGSGVMEVRIEVGLIASSGDVTTTFPNTGACYDITGVIGSFNLVAQLKPRTLADLEVVPCN